MDEMVIWNKLTELNPELAYQFYLVYVYRHPATGRKLQPQEIYKQKLEISKTQFYERRTTIFEVLGTSNISDEHIRIMVEMVGDDPKLLKGPAQLADWPPPKKEPPEEETEEDVEPEPIVASVTAIDDQPEQEDVGGNGDDGQGQDNGEDAVQEPSHLVRTIAAIIAGILILGVLGAATFFFIRWVNCEVIGNVLGIECEPAVAEVPEPTEEVDNDATVAAIVQLTIDAMPTIATTEESTEEPIIEPTVDVAAAVARTVTAVAATMTAEAPTDEPTPVPPTPIPIIVQPLALPFMDNFDTGYSSDWNVIEGEVLINNGRLTGRLPLS